MRNYTAVAARHELNASYLNGVYVCVCAGYGLQAITLETGLNNNEIYT